MAVVSIVRCGSYELDEVRAAVRACLRALPAPGDLVPRGAQVLLKPNLLSSSAKPEAAVNTHPSVIRAVAEFFREEFGCSLAIGDSCGSLAPGSTERALATTQVPEICRDLGAEIVNFDRAGRVEVEVPGARLLKRVGVARPALECGALVSLPKLKTHSLTLLTGAIKNQFGVVPGGGKKDIHMLAPKPVMLAHALVDLCQAVRPCLSVMDAVVGMEGNGPAAGRPRAVGLILASTDAVALDAVAAAIIGYGPGDVPTIRFAGERGLGTADLARIEIRGPRPSEVCVPDFDKPVSHLRTALWKMLPAGLVRFLFNYFGSATGSVRPRLCKLCGECVANCPVGALVMRTGRIEADASRCISCYCCHEICPHGAIEMKRPLGAKVYHWVVGRLSRG